MPAGDFLAGVALFTATTGGAALAAWLVVRAHLVGAGRLVAAVAWGLLATAAVVLVHLVPLALGVLTRGLPALLAVALVALAWRLRASEGARGLVPARPAAPSTTIGWAIAGVAALVAVVHAVAFLGATRLVPVDGYDSLNIHLPIVARWIHDGTLWGVESTVPGWAFGHYPATGNLVQLAAVLPWPADFALRFVNAPFLALTAAAVAAGAVELGASRAAGLTFGVLVAATPMSATFGLDNAMPDAVAHATFAAGALFLFRHARTAAAPDLVLAGVGLGLSFGVKWYGPPQVAAVLALWLAGRVVARGTAGRAIREALAAGGLVLAAGGVWLVRNLVLSGNPLFPQRLDVAGVTVLDAPPDPMLERFGFSLLDYVTEVDVWRELILDQLWTGFGPGGALLLALAVAAAVVSVARRAWRAAAVAVAALALVLLYAAMPYTALGSRPGRPDLVLAGGRYAVPALAVAAVAGAWLATRAGRAGLALQALAGLAVLDAVRRDGSVPGAERFADVGTGDVAQALAVLAAAGAVVALLVVVRRPAARVAVAAVLAAGVVVAADRHQQAFADRRYAQADPVLRRALADAPAEGARIALAGVTAAPRYAPAGVLAGSRVEHDVRYVGPAPRDLLERYRDGASFRRALRGFDLLVVGAEQDGRPAPEATWAGRAGWSERARSRLYVLFAPPARG